MTVYVSVAPLIWAALAALFVARYSHRIGQWVDRVLALMEARAHFAPADMTGPGEPMPDDLLGIVNALSTGTTEGDELLRQQTVSLLYEKYSEFGNWDKVRAWSAVNIGTDTRQDGWGLA